MSWGRGKILSDPKLGSESHSELRGSVIDRMLRERVGNQSTPVREIDFFGGWDLLRGFRIGAWLTRAVGCLLFVTSGLLIVSVGQDLVDGVTTSTNKWGPRMTYSLGRDSFRYWAAMASSVVVAIVLAAMSVGAFCLARLEDKVEHPQKKSRRKK